jgi:hypothetical protein
MTGGGRDCVNSIIIFCLVPHHANAGLEREGGCVARLMRKGLRPGLYSTGSVACVLGYWLGGPGGEFSYLFPFLEFNLRRKEGRVCAGEGDSYDKGNQSTIFIYYGHPIRQAAGVVALILTRRGCMRLSREAGPDTGCGLRCFDFCDGKCWWRRGCPVERVRMISVGDRGSLVCLQCSGGSYAFAYLGKGSGREVDEAGMGTLVGSKQAMLKFFWIPGGLATFRA